MVKKQLIVLNTTVMLGLGSVFALPTAKADTISSQRATIQTQIQQANQEIYQVQDELSKLNEQLKRAEQAVIDNQNMISKTESDIATTNQEIKNMEEEIASLKAAIEKRNQILKERARSYQETGGTTQYFDVLLGSSSFGDFVERVGAVATIMNADKDLMEKHEADVKKVEEKQTSMETKLAELNNMKTELEGMQAQILEQKAQNDALREELKQKEAAGLSAKANLQQQDSNLASQQAPIVTNQATQATSSSFNIVPSGPVVAPSASASEKIAVVTTVGNRYIGNSVYVFGGGRTASDVANGRFDCSGFVHWAFSQAGISIGSSTDSLKNSGRRVSTSEMRPGDLVFFNTYKTDGHVGIYLGGGKFIGSQSSTGVAVANMSSGYWASTFNGRVVRIIE
ncbi:coiled-coil domain-containing protein [Bacillus sp. T3]|uniref:coiled-coil domain-containing protein n=1 Tax=Bacillus sp. T3 TaxID=467262 RepID=UPI002981F2B7|nr:NlpC/P60 family protein [Bacillus sp. T3]